MISRSMNREEGYLRIRFKHKKKKKLRSMKIHVRKLKFK